MYKGYKIIEKKYIEDVASNCTLLEHEKTSAKVFLMENNDDNKTFGIAFKTLPKDNTGICHIIEHSVLSGSRKFKTKEPFMDMYKTSMATFLNAMTFPDKTIYPVSSRNLKDFENLMDVYLDAVFFPVMKTDRRIFMQEGWHFELENEKDDLNIKGVVYSEMKGAYSNPMTSLYFRNSQSLCPDTVYAVESGGVPYEIPNLTYEDFCAFHDKYYHPSNSYIFLYGNCDMQKELEYLDLEYLSKFDKKDIENEIEDQKPFKKVKNVFDEYSISKDEDEKNKTFLLYSCLFGENESVKCSIINKLLSDILVDMQGAYLQEALVKSGICSDVSSISMESTKYSSFGVFALNSQREHLEKFKEIVENTLKNVVEKGIEKEKLLASINRVEFSIRDTLNSTTKGIEYFINIFDSWLYGKNPIDSLCFDKALSELRNDILNNRLLEKIIEEKILNNNHKAIIVLAPNKGLNDKKDQAQKQWLKRYKDSLNKIQIEKIINDTKELIKYQQTENTKEQKDSIPKLKLSDVDKQSINIPCKIEKIDDITVLKHDIFTSRVNYVDLCFDLKHIAKEDIFYLSLVEYLMNTLDKKTINYKDFTVETFLHTGGISTAITTYKDSKNKNKFSAKFIVSVKFLDNLEDKARKLLKILLKETVYEDEKRIKEVLTALKNDLEQEVISQGHSFAITRAKSYYSNKGYYEEQIKGLDFLKNLQQLIDNFDNKKEDLIQKLNFIYKRLLKRTGVILNITTNKNLEQIKESFVKLLKEITLDVDVSYDFTFKVENLKEAIKTSSDVNYVAFASSLDNFVDEYNGKFSLISKILSTTYMHENIRAIGGAYGAGFSIGKELDVVMFSYRDPNIVSTKNTFKNIVKYIENLNLSDEDLETFKISAVKDFDPLLSPSQKAQVSMSMYISKSTKEQLEKYLNQLLKTEVKDLNDISKLIEKALEKDNFVVVGNTEKIDKVKDEFKNIYVLKK